MELKRHSHSLIVVIVSATILFAATYAPTSRAVCVPRSRTGHAVATAPTGPPAAAVEPPAATSLPSISPSPFPSTASFQTIAIPPSTLPVSDPATSAPSSAPSPSPTPYQPPSDADADADTDDTPQTDPPATSPPSSSSSSSAPAEPATSPSTTSLDPTSNNDAAAEELLGGLAGSLYARQQQQNEKQQAFKIPTHSPADPSLSKVCANTDYPSLCVASLSPFFLSGRANSVAALEVAIKAAVQHAKLAIAAAARLAASSSSDEETVAGLASCKDSYNDALDNLHSAADALVTRDVGTANSMLSAVVTDSENCEDAFQGGDSPMFEYNDKLRKMASNCLAIASLIN